MSFKAASSVLYLAHWRTVLKTLAGQFPHLIWNAQLNIPCSSCLILYRAFKIPHHFAAVVIFLGTSHLLDSVEYASGGKATLIFCLSFISVGSCNLISEKHCFLSFFFSSIITEGSLASLGASDVITSKLATYPRILGHSFLCCTLKSGVMGFVIFS